MVNLLCHTNIYVYLCLDEKFQNQIIYQNLAMMKKFLFFVALILAACIADTAYSQNMGSNTKRIQCPDGIETYYSTPLYFDISPPMRDLKNLKPTKDSKERENHEVPNYVSNMEGTVPFNFREDPVWQKQDATYRPLTSGPIVNIDGIGNIDGYMPPDTQGDVGLNQYVQVVNSRWAVYPKTGSPTPIYGPAQLSVIWTALGSPWAGRNDGDPIVLYDQQADRWMISQFALPSSSQQAVLVAISTTNDPAGTWYRYVYNFGTIMPDYPKFGVWWDGYYMSVNQFTGASGAAACVWQRSKMLSGDPTAGFIYKNCSSAGGIMLPSDWDGPTAPAGEPNYFTFFTGSQLKVWSFITDWTTWTNSTITETSNLTPAAFSSYFCSASRGRCIPQPGTSLMLESMSDRLMFRLQYRNFGSYQSMVTCHTVNVGSGVAGIRWYELRRPGSGAWTIYQQGTYSPDASCRWMGSAAMNAQGDIAIGYSVSDATTTYPSIRYTGRRAADPPGQMTIAEQTAMTGTASQQYSTYGRWGDYSMMSVDPSDDNTFYYTTEYYVTWASTWPWHTRIASFKFSNNPAIITTAATGVTATAATLNGTINPNGLTATYHFEWGTSVSYGNSTTPASAGSGSSAVPVSAPISGLSGGITYHFRLVGTNSEGTTTGNDMSFTTGAAAVTTTTPSAITLTSATGGGTVVSDGGVTVTARGVCWGTSANPTIAGSHTTDGGGLGTFTSSITPLTSSTLYHVRAYATNTNGTVYGDDLTFTTLCGIYSLPFTENFTGTTLPSCWSQVDHQGNGQVWQFGTITGTDAPILTGNYAFLNSDGYASGNSQNADLISPVINCTGLTNITLAFSHYFKEYSAETGTLSYSINGGTTWTTIQTFTTTSATNPIAFSQVIAGASGQAQVQFRWNYTGSYGWWWGIDNISVTGSTANTLSVTPPNQNVSSAAGSTAFTVTSNTTWNASSNQSWCTVTPSGTGNGSITANYTAFAGVGTRVATITVTGTSAPTATVTVTQTGVPATLSVTPSNQNVPGTPAGNTSFTVTSNTAWTVISDQSWCTVTPSGTGNGTITANYSFNPTLSPRVANVTVTVASLSPITVTVTQAAGTGSLVVTPPAQYVAYSPASSIDFTVTSNTSWAASSNVSWCTVTPSGTGNGTISAAYTVNPDPVVRTATITVTATGLPSVAVTLTQDPAPLSISVLPSNQNVPASPTGTTTFSVTSNTSWSAVSDQSWCSVTSGGTGNGTIIATYAENTNISGRLANITVTVPGLSPVVVTVSQAGLAPTLAVAPSNRNVTYPAGATTFTVTSNSTWTAVSDSAWLNVTSGGTGNGTINATYLENPYHVSRVARVTVTVSGLSPQVVTVTQAQSTVAVQEHNTQTIRIIPNPSKGSFRVDVGDLKFTSLNVSVMDMNGKTILYRVCWDKPELKFDLSSSPEGSYVIKVSNEDMEVTQKLILKH